MKPDQVVKKIDGKCFLVVPTPLMSDLFLRVAWFLKDSGDSSVKQVALAAKVVRERKK